MLGGLAKVGGAPVAQQNPPPQPVFPGQPPPQPIFPGHLFPANSPRTPKEGFPEGIPDTFLSLFRKLLRKVFINDRYYKDFRKPFSTFVKCCFHKNSP